MNCPRCGQPQPDASRFCNSCGASIGEEPTPVPGSTPPPPSTPGKSEEPTAVWHINVGDVLDGKWKLEAILGQGGMGTVFLAQDIELERKVAVKVLATALCCDAAFVARFTREAKLTAQLEHPNIVSVYSVGRWRGRPFIVMKNLKGVTLHRYLRSKAKLKQRMTRAEVLHVFRQLGSGMDFIHAAGFVHRDIKASNIFLSPEGLATILDFGILRDVNATQGLTQTGTFLGTPHYMSPEQALGGKDVDHRADLYALGVLLFECISGAYPFSGQSDLAVIQKHAHEPPPDLSLKVRDLPRQAAEVVQKSLAKAPDDRFQSGAELFSALANAWPTADGTVETGPQTVPMGVDIDLSVAERITPSKPGAPSVPGALRQPTTRPPQPPPDALEAPEAEEPADVPGPDDAPKTTPVPRQPPPVLTPSVSPPSSRRKLAFVAAGAVPLLALGGWLIFRPSPPVDPPKPFALPTPIPTPPPPEPAKPVEVPVVPPTPTPPVVTPTPVPANPEPPKPDPAKAKPKKGRLQVITTRDGEPLWASVKVDGASSGETPLILDLAPGKHTVAIERAGFKPVAREVVVKPGQTAQVKAELVP